MGDSLRTAWNKATIMRSMVLIGSFLACVSSVPFDAGYGVPAAPLIASPPVPVVSQPLLHSIPAPAAPLPLQLLNAGPILQQAPIPVPHVAPAPLVHSVPQPVLHSAPAPIQVATPAFAPAPLPIPASPSSQFHAQDEFGQFSFGYENINSAKTETKDAFGVTRGSYQYVDANGILQTVNYIADPVNGFRVAGTNIPVAPEVAAARAEHLAAHEKAKAEAAEASIEKREAEPIDGDYEIPAAPVLRLPVPLVHNVPA